MRPPFLQPSRPFPLSLFISFYLSKTIIIKLLLVSPVFSVGFSTSYVLFLASMVGNSSSPWLTCRSFEKINARNDKKHARNRRYIARRTNQVTSKQRRLKSQAPRDKTVSFREERISNFGLETTSLMQQQQEDIWLKRLSLQLSKGSDFS